MLPDADDEPSKRFQVGVGLGIALDVAAQLRDPPGVVAGRPGAVDGTRVPETAVDEDRHPLPREDDVGSPSRETWQGAFDAIPETPSVQFAAKRELRGSVLARLLGHATSCRRVGRQLTRPSLPRRLLRAAYDVVHVCPRSRRVWRRITGPGL